MKVMRQFERVPTNNENRTQNEENRFPRVCCREIILFSTVPCLDCFRFSCTWAVFPSEWLETMKSEIVIELLKIMLRKFLKTKIIVWQNVNFMLNFLNSYDGSRRRRDRSKRSLHRLSPEQDVKQQRRHRKPTNAEKIEAARAKVSFKPIFPIKRNTFFIRSLICLEIQPQLKP